MPSTVTLTESPTCIGPTPSGVPVRITSPGSSVMKDEMYSMISGTLKNMSEVLPFCLSSSPPPRLSSRVVTSTLRRVEVGLDPRSERAERVEALGAGPLTVLGLQVARGDVVGDGVAEDHLGGVLGGDVAADAADHDGELGLVVHVLALRRGRRSGRRGR